MKKSLENFDFLSKKNRLDDLEKLAGFIPDTGKKNITADIAKAITKKVNKPNNRLSEKENNKYWKIHKKFAELNESMGRSFSLFIGDLLDIILNGPVQAKLISEMIELKISKIRKQRNSEREQNTRKILVASKRNPKYEVKIGGKQRIFPQHFLKRKSFLASLFLDHDEYSSYLKLVKQIEFVCNEEKTIELPATQEERKKALQNIIDGLKYEINREDLINAWILLQADYFENLGWIFKETKKYHLVRPNFYEDLDKAYRTAKNLLKLVISDFKEEFPPTIEKQDAIIDYLEDALEVYTHHHFVIKFFNQTRPTVTLKDFEMTKKDLEEKISELRNENNKLQKQVKQITHERDTESAQLREMRQENDVLLSKLKRFNPDSVQKQTQSLEAKINSLKKELKALSEAEAERVSALRALDSENQKLTKTLQELKAIPDENAYSVTDLLKGKHVAIFGGIGRDHYWPILKEAGVKNDDYEWFDGYHTISLSRTSEIVGRCDLVVVVTSYAGHLLLYQVRPCIKPHQHFFKIHNSGAGSLRKEILKVFQKAKS